MLHASVIVRFQEARLGPRAAAAAARVPLHDERAVIARLKAGDRSAVATLYAWFHEPVWHTILARCPDRTKAEDCLRDTFRTVLEKIAQFESDELSIEHWIRRIAIHKAMDVHRATARDRALEERVLADPSAVFGSPAPRPDRGLEVEDTARDVEISLSRLNERYAQALRLRLLDDQPRETCAEQLGVTLGTFDVLLHRAAKAFRKVYPP